jgi:hypothetical protein
MEPPPEISRVSRNTVRHSPLHVVPDKFVGIEFRCIRRQKERVKARPRPKELGHSSCTMLLPTVPEQDDRAAKMPEKVAEKPDDLLRSDVLLWVELTVQPEATVLRRHGQGGDCRDLGPMAGGHQNGCPAPGSPGAADRWDEKEAALIQESQVGSKLCGFFLCGATRVASSIVWPSRFVPCRGSWASGTSSPCLS